MSLSWEEYLRHQSHYKTPYIAFARFFYRNISKVGAPGNASQSYTSLLVPDLLRESLGAAAPWLSV